MADQDNNLPDWLTQFRKELQNKEAESSSLNDEGENDMISSNKMKSDTASHKASEDIKPILLKDLVGYENAITKLYMQGICFPNPIDQDVIASLNKFYGLENQPCNDPILIYGESEDDTDPFAFAIVDEFDDPTVVIDFGMSGNNVPAVAVSANREVMKHCKNKSALDWISKNNGILVLKQLENWNIPFVDDNFEEELVAPGIFALKIAQGGQEVLNMIFDAIHNPNVQIIATSYDREYIRPEVLEQLGNYLEIEIKAPDDNERKDVWEEQISAHPSCIELDAHHFAKLSEGLFRSEIRQCAEEAVRSAYRRSLATGKVETLTPIDIYEKLIHRVDRNSDSYKYMEDQLIKQFNDSF